MDAMLKVEAVSYTHLPLCSSLHAASSSATPASIRSWSTAPGAPLRLSYWLPIGVEETPRHTRPRAMAVSYTHLGVPNKTKVATISKEDVRKIAETKMPDLNAASIEAAMSMIAGTARSMGVVVGE